MEKNRNDMAVMPDTEIEPFTLLLDILKNWWVILLGALAGAMLMHVFVNVRYVPEYTTSTTFVVASKDDANMYSNLSSANTMAQTFEKILKSTVMKKTICEELDVEDLNAKISAEVIEGTNLLVLKVTADTPKYAIDVIRTITDHYTEVSFYTIGNAVMNVLEEPKVPYSADNPLNVREAEKKGFFGGLAVCIVLFGLLSYMNDTVKQEKEVEKKLDARSLGAIAYEQKYKTLKGWIRHKKGTVLIDNPIASFRFVEGYKKLGTKVQYQMDKDDRKVLVVTSVAENEGKSTVAANLALTLSEQSKKVVLIDGDIRRPSQFLIFNMKVEEKHEFGEYLKGNGQLNDVMLRKGGGNLYFIGGKNCYSSSTEILQSDRLPKLLNACRKFADYVIIDTPPAGLIGDAQIFAQKADAVMLVTKQNYMLSEDVNEILDDFRDNHSKVLGVVLNSVKTFETLTEGPIGGYGRYGRYGKYGNYGKNRGN